MNQKGFASIMLIVGVVLVFVIGGYFVWSKKLDNKNIHELFSPSPFQTSISNWKIYTNTEYGFEFEYPSNLLLNGEVQHVYDFKKPGKNYHNIYYEFAFIVQHNDKKLPPEQFFTPSYLATGVVGEINGHKTFELITQDNQRIIYVFDADKIGRFNSTELNKFDFDHIVLTFKFTK